MDDHAAEATAESPPAHPRLLRWALTGGVSGGDAASAVYGTILAASVLIASTTGPVTTLELTLGTGIVFWLAHTHVLLIGRIARREGAIGLRTVRKALVAEWPLVQASFTPAAPLVLAIAGIISPTTAQSLGVLICFMGLLAWGIVVAKAGRLGRGQTALTIGFTVALGLLLVLLKVTLG